MTATTATTTTRSASPPSGRVDNVVIEQENANSERTDLISTPTASLEDVRAQIPVGPTTESPAKSAETSPEALVPDSRLSDNDTSEDSSSHTDKDTDTNTSSSSASSYDHIPRILQKKHFDIALSEIRPSASEEGSLPELRKVGLHIYIS